MKGNGKSRKNGKSNGKARKPSTAAQIATQFKPGNNANPLGARAHKKTMFDHLNQCLEEECTHQIDGVPVKMPRQEKIVRMLVDTCERHLDKGLPRSEMVGHVLNRGMPIPRDPPAIVNLTIDHNSTSVAFLQQVQSRAGRTDVSSRDVLETLGDKRLGRLEPAPDD